MNVTVQIVDSVKWEEGDLKEVVGTTTAVPAVAEEQDAMFYDLLGRPVGTKPSATGIYVTKGKKVMIQ